MVGFRCNKVTIDWYNAWNKWLKITSNFNKRSSCNHDDDNLCDINCFLHYDVKKTIIKYESNSFKILKFEV